MLSQPKESYQRVFQLLQAHHEWFSGAIPLIASENIPSPAVKEAILRSEPHKPGARQRILGKEDQAWQHEAVKGYTRTRKRHPACYHSPRNPTSESSSSYKPTTNGFPEPSP